MNRFSTVIVANGRSYRVMESQVEDIIRDLCYDLCNYSDMCLKLIGFMLTCYMRKYSLSGTSDVITLTDSIVDKFLELGIDTVPNFCFISSSLKPNTIIDFGEPIIGFTGNTLHSIDAIGLKNINLLYFEPYNLIPLYDFDRLNYDLISKIQLLSTKITTKANSIQRMIVQQKTKNNLFIARIFQTKLMEIFESESDFIIIWLLTKMQCLNFKQNNSIGNNSGNGNTDLATNILSIINVADNSANIVANMVVTNYFYDNSSLMQHIYEDETMC